MAFKAPNRGRGNGGNGGNAGSETVTVRLKSLNLVDQTYVAERRPARSHKDDTITAYLMHDACGLTATFDEAGVPLTEVTVKLRESNYAGEHKPYVLADFRKGAKKDAGPKMGANPVLIIENTWQDYKTGELSTGWLRCALPDSAPEINGNVAEKFDQIFPAAWASVGFERTTKNEETGEEKKRQHRTVVWPEAAVAVADLEELRNSEIINYLLPNEDYAGGVPTLTLRLVQINPPQFLTSTVIFGGSRDEEGNVRHPLTIVDDSMARAVDRDESKEQNFHFYLENLGAMNAEAEAALAANPADPDAKLYYIEAIPGTRYTTGQKSLPSQQKVKGRAPDHENFRSFMLDEDNNEIIDDNEKSKRFGKPQMQTMFTKAHMIVKRGEFEEGDVKVKGLWYATGTPAQRSAYRADADAEGNPQFRPNPASVMFPIGELPTAATPPEVAAAFEARAVKRQQLASALQPAKEATATQAGPAVGGDDDIPDQSAGLAMS